MGNSSAGVREAPFLGIPSLDVGSRQRSRSESASVKTVFAEDVQGIKTIIASEWGKRFERDSSFGVGNATKKFIDILEDPVFWKLPLQKHFHE